MYANTDKQFESVIYEMQTYIDNVILETNYRKVASIEDAKKKLDKIKGGKSEADFMDWFKWVFKFGLGGGILTMALTSYVAVPGSAKDKVRRCNQLIKATEKAKNKCEKTDPKVAKEYDKFISVIEKERKQLEDRAKSTGEISGNFKEAAEIYKYSSNNLFDFDIL